MNKHTTIAAAVALALGAATAAQADCSAPTYELYVAGSSAAKASFLTALGNDLFGGIGNVTSFSSTNGDFEAFCGAVAAGTGATATGFTPGSTAILYYRAEGGSVVGVLPIVSGYNPEFLDLTGVNNGGPSVCDVTHPPTTGTSATVGTTDGWGGCVTTHAVEMGVTDLEPSVFVASAFNYPTAYSTAVWGTASPAQLGALSATPLFQQVFGIFVNTSGINGGGTGQAINLSKETLTSVLAGKYTNWSNVPSASGGAVSSTSQTISIKNREAGSGTRTGVSLYFLGQECTTAPAKLKDGAASGDYYATSDALAAAATAPGSITYASIDNNGKQPNLTMASLSGVTPSNLNAAAGQYDWWYEATAVGNTANITSNGGLNLYTWLVGGELGALATAPHAADINVIPNLYGNTPTVPLASNTVNSKTIYINPWSRQGNSCNLPAEGNQ